jgi:hypothetical protein
VTPEYNNSLPGPFKKRSTGCRAARGHPARVRQSRGCALRHDARHGRDEPRAQAAWLPVLRALGVRPWLGGSLAAEREKAFDDRVR